MKFEPDIEHMKAWFFAEQNSQHGLAKAIEIADRICQGKKYSEDVKLEFLSRKGSLLFRRGRENIHFDPSRGLADLEAALSIHLSAYERAFDTGNPILDKTEEYSRNSAYVLLQFLEANRRYNDLVEAIIRVCSGGMSKLDPIEDPITRAIELLPSAQLAKGDVHRCANRLDALVKIVDVKLKWYDRFAQQRVVHALKGTSQQLVRDISRKRGPREA